mmetsp:Transcript_48985/g.153851  ORF Transcript_48985/g.153851 Transcript_48985/m.153851 type:complete len:81 (-) Transcript_48985:363-605(-)
MVRSHCTFSGHYTTAGAMASSKEEFSGNFYMKFLAFVALALCVVGMAFVVMNHWLAVRFDPEDVTSSLLCRHCPPRSLHR